MSPIQAAGLSRARAVIRKNVSVEKALKEARRRSEAVDGHRQAFERTRELERKKRPKP